MHCSYQKHLSISACRYLAQHSAFADLVDYSGFTAVVDPAELESANVIEILEQRYDKSARLKLMKRLHQVPLQKMFMLLHLAFRI